MEKENFKFINEGNGIEGLISNGKIAKKQENKVMVIDKKSNLVWDPIFECFIQKDDNTKEKGTVSVKHLH